MIRVNLNSDPTVDADTVDHDSVCWIDTEDTYVGYWKFNWWNSELILRRVASTQFQLRFILLEQVERIINVLNDPAVAV